MLCQALRAGAWREMRLIKSENGRGFRQRAAQETWIGTLNLRAEDESMKIVLKRTPAPSGLAKLARLIAGGSRAQRQWRGAELIEKAGVATSTPLALLRGRTGDGPGMGEWLALEFLSGDAVIDLLNRGGLSQQAERALAERLGALVRTLVTAGVFNRDHKLSNLVRRPDGAIGVIDTVGVRKTRDQRRACARMLAAMVYESHGLGLLPRRALLARCARSATEDWKQAWREVERLFARHGETRPTTDPRMAGRLPEQAEASS